MQLVAEKKEFCVKTQQMVMLTSYVEAECGEYGCAIQIDGVEYECEKQRDCPSYKAECCLLNRL